MSNSNIINTNTMEKRRAFTKRENLRRKVYRDMTSFQMYPLQAMAMDDYDKRLKEYFENSLVKDNNEGGGGEEDEDSDGSDCEIQQPRRMVQHTKRDNVVSNTSSSAKNNHEFDMLRQQFMQEFLKEQSIMPSIDNMKKQGQGDDDTEDIDKTDNSSNIISPTYEKENASINDKENTGETNLLQETFTIHQKEHLQTTSSDEHNVQNNIQQQRHQQQQQLLPTLWCMEPRLFACETTLKGKRRYISTHLGRFMDHYWRECDVYNRHYYELIKENSPCRLYFDLEFNKHSNPNLTPTITEDLLTELFNELCLEFQRVYTISISRNCMVDLDSSTSKKFSRHWILHLPNGELFSDAREVGIFVKVFVSRLEKEENNGVLQSRGHELLANNLFVNAEDSKNDDDNDNKSPKLTRFIDLGVYTRNRIFRILGSTKHGKTPDAALRIAEANEFPFPRGFDNTKFYLPMMNQGWKNEPNVKEEGDICEELQKVAHNEGNDCVATTENDDDDFQRFCESFSWENHATALAATLVVPPNASKMQYPILTDPSSLLNDDEKQQFLSLRHMNGGTSSNGSTTMLQRPTTCYGSSPFPKLDEFILNTLGKRKGLVGNIGTWSIGTQEPLPQTVCYNMKDNRWCERLGRAHRSNNIMWNVHLFDRICWQGCHDPECRGFRGQPMDLPEEVNLEIDEYFLDYELASLNENEAKGEPNDVDEFDDALLEAAMQTLDISTMSSTQRQEEETALNVDASVKPEDTKTGVGSPWKIDSDLDSELANLDLSELQR